MNSNLISLVIGIAAGAVVYTFVGKRIGYGNTRRVWTAVGLVFIVAYIIVLLTLTQVVHYK